MLGGVALLERDRGLRLRGDGDRVLERDLERELDLERDLERDLLCERVLLWRRRGGGGGALTGERDRDLGKESCQKQPQMSRGRSQ